MKKSIFYKILLILNVSLTLTILSCVVSNSFISFVDSLDSFIYLSCTVFGVSALIVGLILIYSDRKNINNLNIEVDN